MIKEVFPSNTNFQFQSSHFSLMQSNWATLYSFYKSGLQILWGGARHGSYSLNQNLQAHNMAVA
jgi:hypothetical protein